MDLHVVCICKWPNTDLNLSGALPGSTEVWPGACANSANLHHFFVGDRPWWSNFLVSRISTV